MEDKLGYPGFKHNHSDFIAELVKQINCKTYLELGVYDGTTLSIVSPFVDRVIGVDIKDVRNSQIGEFHLETTDSFFEHFNETVDVIFIDADHNFESVKKDFKNSLKLLNKYGMIILHDTDPNGRNVFKSKLLWGFI
jgi:predicted O-methyltransferase YrrM